MHKKTAVATEPLTKVMTWDKAEEACNSIWDDFEEKWKVGIDAEIARVQALIAEPGFSPDSVTSSTEAERAANELRLERMKNCKVNFHESLEAWRRTALEKLESMLMSQEKKRKTGPVDSRHASKKQGSGVKKTKRKPGRKKAPMNRWKRKHVKTGRPRGWNNGRWVLPHQRAGNHPPVRELRKRRAAKRMQEKSDRRVRRALRILRWSERYKRHWKPYPWHRGEKVKKWLEHWLSGKIKKWLGKHGIK
jgi:hypothetical protein